MRRSVDWASAFTLLKCCAVILGLLAAFLILSGCVVAPPGYGYYHPRQYQPYYGGGRR